MSSFQPALIEGRENNKEKRILQVQQQMMLRYVACCVLIWMTNRQTDRQTDRQINTKTEREREREREGERERE